MTGCSEDFLCEDDFDTVLGIIDADMLESNKDFIQERVFFIPKVNQSESLMNPCTECAQICILKGGLTRHNKKKNSKSFWEKTKDVRTANEILSPEELKIFIEKSYY